MLNFKGDTVELGSLGIGETFMYDNEFYIATDETDGEKIKAVCFDGYTEFFRNNTKVRKVDCEVKIV